MKRETFDENRDPPPPGPPGLLPCRTCGDMTRRATLSAYGARCARCYELFCAQGISGMAQGFTDGRRDTPDQATMRLAAAKALARRSGEGGA